MNERIPQVEQIRDLLMKAHWKRDDAAIMEQIGAAMTQLESSVRDLANAGELALGFQICTGSPCHHSACAPCRLTVALKALGLRS